MNFALYFGPDRVPFVLDHLGAARAADGVPFHGIVSRGLRNALEREHITPEVWARHAHRLTLPASSDVAEAGDLTTLRALASACGVLSFGESAVCVRNYLAAHYAPVRAASRVEIWNVKEGHTSS